MFHIGQDNNLAIIFSSEQYAKESGLPCAEFDFIPEGTGLLKTDLKTLWWEPVPEPEPAPSDPQLDIAEMLIDLEYRTSLLELGVI